MREFLNFYNKILYAFAAIFFIFIFSMAISQKAYAQTYTCIWDDSTGGEECIPDNTSDCLSQPGCTANCNQYLNYRDCYTNNPHNCICPPGNPNDSKVDFDYLYAQIGSHYSSTSTIGGIISTLLLYVFPIAGLLLLLFLIIGGFRFMFSAGDPKAAQSARSIITTAIIGFFIIFFAYWLTRLLGTILGLGQITSIF